MASVANDGDAATSWRAAAGDAAPWWQVDLETVCRISSVALTFPTASAYRFRIEVSADGHAWREAAHATAASGRLRLPEGTSGRYLRVAFAGPTASLSELEITGRL